MILWLSGSASSPLPYGASGRRRAQAVRTGRSMPPQATTRRMPEPFADTLAKVAAGRIALVERLRTLATRIEALPLDSAVEALVLLEPAAAAFEQHAALALERAPTGAS